MQQQVFTAVGVYPLGNASDRQRAVFVIQTRSPLGATWGIRTQLTGSDALAAPQTPLVAGSGPRTGFTDLVSGLAVAPATAITGTTAAQLHEVYATGRDVYFEVLTAAGPITVEYEQVTG